MKPFVEAVLIVFALFVAVSDLTFVRILKTARRAHTRRHTRR